jgi:hypothetical protein
MNLSRVSVPALLVAALLSFNVSARRLWIRFSNPCSVRSANSVSESAPRAIDVRYKIRTEKWQSSFKLLNSKVGSPAWIRTTIHGSKGRCPTIRRPGNI